MVYGYFYIKVYKEPNKKITVPLIELAISMLNEKYNVDKILYDYIQKPSNPSYKSFRDMLLKIMKTDDTLVVPSLFQLGKTKEDIYEALSIMRAKQVRLFVLEWEVNISSTMTKVKELSVDDLAVYENTEFSKINFTNYTCIERNDYRKIAGYQLNEKYIERESNPKKYSSKYTHNSYDERKSWSRARWMLYHEQGY